MKRLQDQELASIMGGSRGNCIANIVGGAVFGLAGFGWTGPGAIVGAIGGALIGASNACFTQ